MTPASVPVSRSKVMPTRSCVKPKTTRKASPPLAKSANQISLAPKHQDTTGGRHEDADRLRDYRDRRAQFDVRVECLCRRPDLGTPKLFDEPSEGLAPMVVTDIFE